MRVAGCTETHSTRVVFTWPACISSRGSLLSGASRALGQESFLKGGLQAGGPEAEVLTGKGSDAALPSTVIWASTSLPVVKAVTIHHRWLCSNARLSMRLYWVTVTALFRQAAPRCVWACSADVNVTGRAPLSPRQHGVSHPGSPSGPPRKRGRSRTRKS